MIVAGLATIPSRLEQVKKTVESLLPQVDKIHLALNDFSDQQAESFEWGNPKIWHLHARGSDEQKFKFVAGDIYLSCDDDLIYPPDYVEVIKSKLEVYDIITFHGRNFGRFPIQSYYKSAKEKFRCLDTVKEDSVVEFGGTGCMAFKPLKFRVTLNDFPSKHMADVHVAIKAVRERKQIVCIAHEAGWIKYQPVSDTIYDRFKDNDFEQTERINDAFAHISV